jgi:hypothetical protein
VRGLQDGREYKAKVLEGPSAEETYLVHQIGWNSKFDAWVSGEELRVKKKGAVGGKKVVKSVVRRSGGVKKVSGKDGKKMTKPKTQPKAKSAAKSAAKKENKEKKTAKKVMMMDSLSLPIEDSAKLATLTTNANVELTEEEKEERRVRFALSPTLKKAMLRDYEESRGTDPRAYVKPSVSVKDILDRFVAEASKKSAINAPRIASLARDVERYFDATLESYLLYKDEWHTPSFPKPSVAYGVTHLLRLLSRIPDMIPPESFPDVKRVKFVNAKLGDLAKFIAAEAESLGVSLEPVDASVAVDV